MIVYPAIDLRQGRCVRLHQGQFDRETVYGDDPMEVARGFAAAGAGGCMWWTWMAPRATPRARASWSGS